MNESDVRDAVASALQLVNMQDYIFRATHTLSGGQRQRIAIAGRWKMLLMYTQLHTHSGVLYLIFDVVFCNTSAF